VLEIFVITGEIIEERSHFRKDEGAESGGKYIAW
jgi:hypothetical protein